MTETNPPGAVVVLRGAHGLAVWPATNGLGWRTYDNGEWGAPSTISDSNLSYYVEPTLAMNDLGQAVLLWRDAGSTDAYAGTIQGSYFDGSAWSPPHTVSVPGAHATAWWQAVDINDVGTAVAAWADFESTGTYTRIWAGILDVGSGQPVWQAPVAIDMPSPNADLADEPQNVRDISVALDPAGSVAYVVYMQHADSPATTPFTWVNWLE